MDPWYRVVTPRKEVREGRSFNPDEFAIALDQVVDGKAPADYQDPEQFFSRTYFTQSLTEHTGTVLRRLSGQTESCRPGTLPHHPVRGWKDPHADEPVPHRPGRKGSGQPDRSSRPAQGNRSHSSRRSESRHLRGQRLGPQRRDRNSLD